MADDTEFDDEILLNIDTLIKRPVIAIDQQPYELSSPEELTLMQSQYVAAQGRKLDRLMKADKLDVPQREQLKKTLEKIVGIIMAPVPEDVRANLSQAQKLSVIEVFTMLSLARKVKLAGATARGLAKTATHNEAGATGVTSSPGSSDSTAATPTAG